jgi:xanthine dehydrogenase accessory factor
MICSGEQTIFLYHIQDKDISAINAIITSEKNHKNGTLHLSGAGILFSEDLPNDDFLFTQSSEEFILKEKTGYKNILHICGGGHCALALSKLISDMDFYIHVYDERAALNTMEHNNFAHKKHLVNDYSEINSIESGGSVYVVIMTFGYRTDDIAIRALINKKFKYLGVLGSKKKMEKMFADYRKENFPEEFLASIHTPIGLNINSRTTPEIAVSIAAEIINVKNR